MAKIEDGTGQGYYVKVNNSNRLTVTSEAVSGLAVAALEREDAYIVTSGATAVALTTTAQHGILTVKNTSSKLLSIGGIYASSDQAGTWRAYRQPTATLTGGALTPVQMNFSSSKLFPGVATKGATGNTMTGTVIAVGYTVAGFKFIPFEGAIVLGQNDVIGLSFQPVTATANVTYNLVAGFLQDS
jgi:hypothetical protein